MHLIEDAAHAVTGSGLFSFIVMLILSIFILFFALYFIVKLMKSLVVDRAEIVLNNVISKSPILGMLAGWAFTTIVQSSSITTSLMIPLVAAGILTLETVFPITIGANVGTTMTAILASFAADQPAAVVIAFAHFLFNITGTVLIYPIRAIRMIPITLARSLGDLAARKRRYAIIYVLGLFFALPITLILISKLFK